MKINETTMREQYDGQYKTFCKKNSDYGNSFEESLDKHGIVASVVRMGDKMNRLEALTDDAKTQQVGSESLLDTLEDLSNYAAMTACWLKGVRAEDGDEEVTHVYTFGQDEPYMTFRNPKYDLNDKLTQAKQRNECYKEIASLILRTPWLSFDGFSGYVDTFRELMPDEKKLIKEGVATEIYSQTDKNPGGEEESEFRSKKFNIPTEECKTENLTFKPQKEDEEEKEPLNEKMFKAILWLFHPIIDKNYRGDDNDSDC